MKIRLRQTAHLVEASPWPIQISIMLGTLLIGIIVLILNKISKGLIGVMWDLIEQSTIVKYGLLGVIIIFILWLRDIIRESVYTGNHTKKVRKGIMLGYILFIITEIMVFVSIFWTVLNTTISPNNEILGMWPPKGIKELEGLELPLNNTIILLGSGITITIGHNKIISLNKRRGIIYIIITILLSLWFSMNQLIEYKESSYTINDSIFGSGFYVGTGLHGLHIIIGTIFIIIGLYRVWKADMTNNHHIGLETGILYLHFVDIIWLVLYIIVYNPIWS